MDTSVKKEKNYLIIRKFVVCINVSPSGSSNNFFGNGAKYECESASSAPILLSGSSCSNAPAIDSPSTISYNRGKLSPSLRVR